MLKKIKRGKQNKHFSNSFFFLEKASIKKKEKKKPMNYLLCVLFLLLKINY